MGSTLNQHTSSRCHPFHAVSLCLLQHLWILKLRFRTRCCIPVFKNASIQPSVVIAIKSFSIILLYPSCHQYILNNLYSDYTFYMCIQYTCVWIWRFLGLPSSRGFFQCSEQKDKHLPTCGVVFFRWCCGFCHWPWCSCWPKHRGQSVTM